MRRLTVFSCFATLFACSSMQTSVKQEDGFSTDADGSRRLMLPAIGRQVKIPGPEWQAIRDIHAEGSDRTIDLLLRNRRTGANITCVLYPAAGLGTALMADDLRQEFEHGGAETTPVDFSDPTGARAAFGIVMNVGGQIVKGKVVVLRPFEGSDATVAVYGIWPAKLEGQSAAVMDGVVSDLSAVKPK